MPLSQKKRKVSAQNVPHKDPEESSPETRQGRLEPSAPAHRMGQEGSKVKGSKSITALALSSDHNLIAIALEKRINTYTQVGRYFELVDETGEEPSNILQLSLAPNATRAGEYILASSSSDHLSTEAASGITAKLMDAHWWKQNETAILSIQQGIKDTLTKALDIHTSERQTKLEGNTAIFSPDGRFLLCFTQAEFFGETTERNPSRIIVWDNVTKQPRYDPLGHSDGILWAGISPDSKLIGAIEMNNTVRIWLADSGICKNSFAFPCNAEAMNGAFPPDSKYFALNFGVICCPSEIQIFDITTGNRTSRPNGNLLATAGYFGDVSIWDVTNGLERMEWVEDRPGVEDDPDSYLASDIRFWDDRNELVFEWSGVTTRVYNWRSCVMHTYCGFAERVRRPVNCSEYLGFPAHSGSTLGHILIRI
ncbi:hypothetical protein BO83DRAFT_410619 [Aspergillus eucalypticola CBS 122712]|uniref:WD40 repeat-like protein n=1 Tax=Aspergillus eucalypticola (strain CBS 122712 / IBT 29274) TaxID=1448314 RepID=A0A317V0C9_ASPEC|nr:uncharacterized protein BO83DRAFT_410619 [Aspergillus eucalypticola CBS 122712]PWY66252.1 hypothetical protein BO83DRAFT_410619 [Aspergillus eucalypticola CBS 122712]